jgi:hypothetical protein
LESPIELTSKPAKARGLWASIRESLQGSEQDFTEGSLDGAVGLPSVPMVLEMAGESVFAICDAFFVARLGSEALAAVRMSMATTALVARRIGGKNERRAARAAVEAIILASATAAVFGLLGAIFAPRLLGLMGVSPDSK